MDIFYSIDWFSSPVLNVLLALFIAAVIIQLYFILFVFTRILWRASTAPPEKWPGVSIIVCAHNEAANLKELLPMLDEQDYPEYEVIVINDRSWDDTEEWAETSAVAFKHVHFMHIDKEYEHVTPKKYALTTGIRHAKHELVLLTDADCRPTTDQWLKGMVECLAADKEIVLGFSPYEKQGGFLNLLIRFETFYTAVQYLSFALAGRPYMGVGRNLSYRKKTFLNNKGFYSHLKVTGGDDDLLMNEIANQTNTAVCLNPDTFMISIPKKTWKEWYRQKKRHLSVSKHYKIHHKIRLACLSTSQVLTWVLGLGIFSLGIVWYPASLGYLIIGGGVFLVRLLSLWVVLGLASRRLYKTVGWFSIPFLDWVLFVYYIIMGVVMWSNRRKKVRWR